MQRPCGIEGWDAFRSIPLMNPCPLTAPRIHNPGCSGLMGNMCDIFNHRLTPNTSTYSSGFVTNSPVIALMPRVTARNLQMFVVLPPAIIPQGCPKICICPRRTLRFPRRPSLAGIISPIGGMVTNPAHKLSLPVFVSFLLG